MAKLQPIISTDQISKLTVSVDTDASTTIPVDEDKANHTGLKSAHRSRKQSVLEGVEVVRQLHNIKIGGRSLVDDPDMEEKSDVSSNFSEISVFSYFTREVGHTPRQVADEDESILDLLTSNSSRQSPVFHDEDNIVNNKSIEANENIGNVTYEEELIDIKTIPVVRSVVKAVTFDRSNDSLGSIDSSIFHGGTNSTSDIPEVQDGAVDTHEIFKWFENRLDGDKENEEEGEEDSLENNGVEVDEKEKLFAASGECEKMYGIELLSDRKSSIDLIKSLSKENLVEFCSDGDDDDLDSLSITLSDESEEYVGNSK